MGESGDFVPAFMLRVLARKDRVLGSQEETTPFIDGRSPDQASQQDDTSTSESSEKA